MERIVDIDGVVARGGRDASGVVDPIDKRLEVEREIIWKDLNERHQKAEDEAKEIYLENQKKLENRLGKLKEREESRTTVEAEHNERRSKEAVFVGKIKLALAKRGNTSRISTHLIFKRHTR